eukprot:2600726-Pyramimonas_sp.AAC.1
MAEHRDELIRDLTQVVTSTVSDQVKDFVAQFAGHSLAAGRLAEGVQQLPEMAKDASEQFCSEKLDAYQKVPRAAGQTLFVYELVGVASTSTT